MKGHLISILALCIALVPTLHAQSTKLTQTQVLHLIEIHAPDELVASQIRARGLSFPVTAKLVDSIAARGAGPLTVAALREHIRTGTVELHTEPGARVWLDGRQAGTANQAGVLILSDVASGNHTVVVSEDSFRDGQNSFPLGNNEHKRISVPLQWTGGYLTLSVIPANAAVAVTGPQPFTGAIANAKCPAGTYTITASAEGYMPLKQEFQVGAGEHHVEQVHLSVDPALLTHLENEIRKDLTSGDTRDALQMAQKAAELSPSDPTVAVLLSTANFEVYMNSATNSERSGNWNDAIASYERAAQSMPAMGEPWLEIGYIQLQQGRFDDAKQSFSKSADLGFPVALNCVEHKSLWNDAGTISIGSHELKFMAKGKEVYRVPISQVATARIGSAALAGPNAYYFDLSFDGKKHRFEFQPGNTQCSFFNGDNLICSGNGLDQQRAVAEWVQNTIGKYASGKPTNQ